MRAEFTNVMVLLLLMKWRCTVEEFVIYSWKRKYHIRVSCKQIFITCNEGSKGISQLPV